MKTQQRWWFSSTCLLALLLLLAACGGGGAPAGPEPAGDVPDAAASPIAPATDGQVVGDRITLGMWTHSAGNPDELSVIQQWIADYNASQDRYRVTLESFPQASYNDSVAAASIAGSLPCIIDLDAPTVPNFAWSGYIQPLPITEADIEARGVLNNDVGRYRDQIYSLGQFDVALVIYGRQSIMDEHGLRVATIEDPWTLQEFNGILDTLKESGEFEYAFDINPGYTGEWWPYAYSPWLQSFGGDLINRDNYVEAEGVLNGSAAVAWGEWFQRLFSEGYANPTPADDQSFLQGEVPLWYSGSWAAQSVLDEYGDDALFMPPPDFGNGPVIGAGSWQLGVSANCPQEATQGAFDFVLFTMEPQNVALMSDSSSLIPTTAEAASRTQLYAENGPFRIFYDMAEAFALVRPETPGYLTISSQFEQAGLKIRDGGNVQDALDDAVDAIERDIADNNGYGFR